jgi:hypothetical protein
MGSLPTGEPLQLALESGGGPREKRIEPTS